MLLFRKYFGIYKSSVTYGLLSVYPTADFLCPVRHGDGSSVLCLVLKVICHGHSAKVLDRQPSE